MPDRPPEEWEPLADHLWNVAERAGLFASAFGAGDWGRLAGLWHDLGKYRPEFQARLLGSREAVEHAGAGAAHAVARDSARGLPLAFVIAGHHAGLANLQTTADGEVGALRPLRERLRSNAPLRAELLRRAPASILDVPLPALPARLSAQPRPRAVRDLELWIRFLFSALVDADSLETERFYTPALRATAQDRFVGIPTLAERLDAHLTRLMAAVPAPLQSSTVNVCRREVLAACRDAAAEPPGLFSLTVPTGGGKTLAAMAFALAHARAHGLARVIVAIPFTSILEQNAEVYAEALGAENVVEHHSGLDPDLGSEESREHERRRALAAENWDAPVVVSTNVQLFESLFTHQRSRARKLHRLAGSVIVLDEVQSLPAGLLAPTLEGLAELTAHYAASVVLSTATQPAFAQRESFPAGLVGVRPIVADPAPLFARLRRVEAHWPDLAAPPLPYAELAERLAAEARVLAIVHRRKDARQLAERLPADGLFHLSALMCAAHRRHVLRAIHARLAAPTNLSCRVVSTQVVEAGVDLDFPLVYRALGGLDSLAQAAGRCNREGRLAPRLGQFHVFRAETLPPPGVPAKGLAATEIVLDRRGGSADLADPTLYEEFFRQLYLAIDPDEKQVQSARGELAFATVAQRYRLIEDGYTEPLCVRWGEGAARLEALRREGAHRLTLRALQPFLVNVPKRDLARLAALGAIETVAETVRALAEPYASLYDDRFGLSLDEQPVLAPETLLS